MLAIALVDRTGRGLWASVSVSVLYFTYVSHLSVAQVGTLAAITGAIGIAGAPLGGRLADRVSLIRVLVALQLLPALASFALLTTDNHVLLIAFSAAGGFGDRAANVLTKLYATRVAGPDRIRYRTRPSVEPRPTRTGPWEVSPPRPPSPSAQPPPTAGSSSVTSSPSSRSRPSPWAAANPCHRSPP
ncbi:MFS transporter [Streptomyces sp. NPDC101455]|uniref:MFS transporter n=1 Tax=Streptomyces sp. NPDC101455 TaxID=3366142 RepID=UPI003830846C